MSKTLKTASLLTILKRWQKQSPHPACELYFETPFQLLVSVILSAQTTDKMVNRCMESVYKAGFTPETVLEWKIEGLLLRIKSIGLANSKAKHIYKMTQLLLEKHEGKIPESREDLEALPGVGRKTASVVLGEIFGQPTLAVDTHVFRVSQRLGLQNEKTPEKAEKALLKLIPARYLPAAHHWFILHGRYTCLARKPLCHSCIVKDLCPSVV